MKFRFGVITLALVLGYALFETARFGDLYRTTKVVLPFQAVSSTRDASQNTTTNFAAASQGADESPDQARWQFATGWGAEPEANLRAFSEWVTRYREVAPAERAWLEAEGVALAKLRRARFLSLIRKNPKAAIAYTVPAAVRTQLPEAILMNIESRVSGRGDLEVVGRTDPTGAAVARRVLLGAERYTASVYGERVSQPTRRNISLHGVALDGYLALSESPVRAFEQGEAVPADKPVADNSCVVSGEPAAPGTDGSNSGAVAAESGDRVYWLCRGGHLAAAEELVAKEEDGLISAMTYSQTGPRNILAMLVDFPDVTGSPVSQPNARSTLESVATFLEQNAVGRFSLVGRTVTQTLRMPRTSNYYRDAATGDSDLLEDARNAAAAAGFNLESFEFDVVVFSHIGMGWSGQGYVGDKGAWVQGTFPAGTLAHELGHNLGLWHANSWQSSTIIGPGGTHTEYGNTFDAMGRSFDYPNKHFSANLKHVLGWLSEANIENVTSSGTYRIYAHDQNSLQAARKYAIRIPVGMIVGGEVEDYWLDFRQLLAGRFSATAAAPILQWGNDGGTRSASRLLDTLPGTSTFEDAPLVIGRVFADPERTLTLQTLAKNGSGAEAYVDVQVVLTAPPIIDLPQALDNSEMVWTTSPVPWNGQRAVNHDGVDAAASGTIGHGTDCWLQTTVTGPGALSFWWKVSSEQGFDYLRVLRNDILVTSMSGEVDWTQRSIEIPPGTHRIRWSYRKDSSRTEGADRGWLDEVAFDRTDRPPLITVQPLPFSAVEGEEVRFRVEVNGSEPLSFQWRRNLSSLPGATNITLTLTNLTLADAGQYSVVVTNRFGSAESSSALLSVSRPAPLAEALDFAGAIWATSGDRLWRGQTALSHDGIDAARSGPILHNQRSILQATIAGPGVLSFWRKVSSEPDFDSLRVTLDGDITGEFSGEQDWTQTSVSIPNGPHTVQWIYSKDSTGSSGADGAWIDQAVFNPAHKLAPDVLVPPTPQIVEIGAGAMFRVTLEGSAPLTFQWLRNGMPIIPRADISGSQSPTLYIANTQTSDAGSYSLSISNPFGSIVGLPAELSLAELTLAEAVDTPRRPWMSGGARAWTPQAGVSQPEGTVARSGQISHNAQTWIETVLAGPAQLSFSWKVSSEANFDFLTMQIDGVDTLEISGEQDWARQTVTVPAGEHIVRWRYRKDLNTIGGADAGWLDRVVVTPSESPSVELVSLSGQTVTINLSALPFPGEYALEVSSDLAAWTSLGTNATIGPSASILRATTGGSEFLRVKLP